MGCEKAYNWERQKVERVFGWVVHGTFLVALAWMAGGILG